MLRDMALRAYTHILAAATPPPGPGFNFRKAQPNSDIVGSIMPFIYRLQDNVLYTIYAGGSLAAVFTILYALFSAVGMNSMRLKKAIRAGIIIVVVLFMAGSYTGILQAVIS
jgi:hypothetical protein